MNTVAENDFWGEPIHVYTRAQAIEDGVLVDLMQPELVGAVREAGIRIPVAMTAAAFTQTIGLEEALPAGQDVQGRLWDVLMMLRHAISRSPGGQRVDFTVSVWDGRKHNDIDLYALCGPGDNAEPIITIMLPNED